MTTDNGATSADPFRTGKAYTISQAAKLADTSGATIRNWLYGYEGPAADAHMDPVFGDRERTKDEPPAVSFLELAEIIVAVRFRKYRIKLERIRRAHAYARRELHVPFPFASLKLISLGGHVLHDFEQLEPGDGKFVVLSAPEQYVLPGIVEEKLQQFDFDPEDSFAQRWYPYGRDIPVVVDPHFAGGRPTIAGRGVTVESIWKRWKAGESYSSIARDYELKPPLVETVLQRVA